MSDNSNDILYNSTTQVKKVNTANIFVSQTYLNKDRLEDVNLDKNILVIEDSPNVYVVLDGHHRLYVLTEYGDRTIDVDVLTILTRQ